MNRKPRVGNCKVASNSCFTDKLTMLNADAPRRIGTNGSTEAELAALSESVKSYRRIINTEGVWLFLATSGCWSVQEGYFRLIAILVALWLFGQRISEQASDKRDLKKQLAAAKYRIEELASSDQERKAALFDVLEFKRTQLDGFTPFRMVSPFLLSWAFTGATLIDTMNSVWKLLPPNLNLP